MDEYKSKILNTDILLECMNKTNKNHINTQGIHKEWQIHEIKNESQYREVPLIFRFSVSLLYLYLYLYTHVCGENTFLKRKTDLTPYLQAL